MKELTIEYKNRNPEDLKVGDYVVHISNYDSDGERMIVRFGYATVYKITEVNGDKIRISYAFPTYTQFLEGRVKESGIDYDVVEKIDFRVVEGVVGR